jgi:hypothetical protein
MKAARANQVEKRWLRWFDFAAAEDGLGPLLHPKSYGDGDWNHFDPDFCRTSPP